MPRVHGQRIMLREYQAEDIGPICSWVNDEATTQYLSTRYWPAQTLVDSEEYLSRILQSSHSAYHFVIADKQDGRYIGQMVPCGLAAALRRAGHGDCCGAGARKRLWLRGAGTDKALCVSHAGIGAAGVGSTHGKRRCAALLSKSRLYAGRREAPCVFLGRRVLRRAA